MPTKADYAKINIACKELGLDKSSLIFDRYHARSSKDLTDQQLANLYAFFRSMGWKPKHTGTKSKGFKEINVGTYAAAQKRYILAMWNALGYDLKKIDSRVKKQFGVERLEWMKDDHDLHVLVTDLRARCERAGIDYTPRGGTSEPN